MMLYQMAHSWVRVSTSSTPTLNLSNGYLWMNFSLILEQILPPSACDIVVMSSLAYDSVCVHQSLFSGCQEDIHPMALSLHTIPKSRSSERGVLPDWWINNTITDQYHQRPELQSNSNLVELFILTTLTLLPLQQYGQPITIVFTCNFRDANHCGHNFLKTLKYFMEK